MFNFLIRTVFFISILLGPSSAFAAKPSFDCGRAFNTVEKTICGNSFIADLDNQLTRIYSRALSVSPPFTQQSLRSDQLAWIIRRNSCESDLMGNLTVTDCIKLMYRSRYNELSRISPPQDTQSQAYYRSGNKDFRAGLYYLAVAKYHDAYKYSTDNVERVRALGALAETSKSEGNIVLAKGYAERILSIDPTSQYAKDVQSLDTYHSKRNNGLGSSPSLDSKGARCLALTWGPDVCSAAFDNYAKKYMNREVNQIVTSPACGAIVAKSLNAEFTEKDATLAVITGALDEAGNAGVSSDDFFENIFGGMAYLYSFAIKASIYDECMRN